MNYEIFWLETKTVTMTFCIEKETKLDPWVMHF